MYTLKIGRSTTTSHNKALPVLRHYLQVGVGLSESKFVEASASQICYVGCHSLDENFQCDHVPCEYVDTLQNKGTLSSFIHCSNKEMLYSAVIHIYFSFVLFREEEDSNFLNLLTNYKCIYLLTNCNLSHS